MNNICGIHHVALLTSDLEKSIKFYTEGLGFKLARSWRNGDNTKTIAMIDLGNGNNLELFSDNDGLTDYPQNAGTYTHLAFRVDDTRKAFERAIEYGATEHMLPKDMTMPSDPPYHVALSFVKGPDGELLEFFEEK